MLGTTITHFSRKSRSFSLVNRMIYKSRSKVVDYRAINTHTNVTGIMQQRDIVRYFSTTALPGTDDRSQTDKLKSMQPWMDTRKNLQRRVDSLLEASSIEPYHFVTLEGLIRECCRKQQGSSLVGLQMAHDILDRLFVEKRRLFEEERIVVTIPSRLLQMVVFGWGVISDQRNVAFFRMKELMQLAVEQAVHDQQIFQTASRDPDSFVLGSGQSLDPPLSQPDVDLYNTYLVGLAQASKSHTRAAIMAQGVLQEMSNYNEERGWHTRPNTKSYAHVITAWGNTRLPEAGERALAVLRALQNTHNEQVIQYESIYGVPYDEQNPSNNKRKIATADIISYTSTLKTLAIRQPEKAMELLHEIMQSETVKPDTRTFVTTMTAFNASASKHRDPRKRVRAAERAEQVLWYMTDFVKSKRHNSADEQASDDEKALLVGYNVCLDIWSKTRTREAAPRCEDILQKMIEDKIYPDTVSFNACLHAWSQSALLHADAAQRASQMLSFQHELARGFLGKSVQPDFQSYAIAIRAHTDSDNPNKIVEARHLLDSLLAHVKNGETRASGNAASPFTAIIGVAIKSPINEAGQLNKVTDAFTGSMETDNNAYSIAQRTFQELRNDVHGLGASPDHHTYGAYLRCIAKHTLPGSSERESKVRIIFEEACEAGAVSRLVIEGMKEANLGRSLALAIPELQSNNLPKFWTRNVPKDFRYKPLRKGS